MPPRPPPVVTPSPNRRLSVRPSVAENVGNIAENVGQFIGEVVDEVQARVSDLTTRMSASPETRHAKVDNKFATTAAKNYTLRRQLEEGLNVRARLRLFLDHPELSRSSLIFNLFLCAAIVTLVVVMVLETRTELLDHAETQTTLAVFEQARSVTPQTQGHTQHALLNAFARAACSSVVANAPFGIAVARSQALSLIFTLELIARLIAEESIAERFLFGTTAILNWFDVISLVPSYIQLAYLLGGDSTLDLAQRRQDPWLKVLETFRFLRSESGPAHRTHAAPARQWRRLPRAAGGAQNVLAASPRDQIVLEATCAHHCDVKFRPPIAALPHS